MKTQRFLNFWLSQSIGEALYFEGLLDLYEAVSSVTLSNALVLLENWGVLQVLFVFVFA